MTRINVGINPEELPNKLLLAEHREITRIPNAVKNGKAIIKNIPKTFRLGPGHVKFFYNKLYYLKKRYNALYNECQKRKFKVTDKKTAFENLPIELQGDYKPTKEDRNIIIQRIKSRNFSLRNF